MNEEMTVESGVESPVVETQAPVSQDVFSLYGEQGPRDEFLNSIPEDYKSVRGIVGKYKNDASLYEGIDNLNKLAMSKGMLPLEEGASDETKEAFMNHMRMVNNVPGEASEYGFTKPEGIDESMWDQESASRFESLLHKHAASPELAKDLFDLYGQDMLNGSEAGKAAQEEAFNNFVDGRKDDLVKTWGSDYQKNNDNVNNLIRTLGADPDKMLKFADAETYEMLGRMTKMVSEGQLTKGSGGELSPAARQSKFESISRELTNMDQNDPMYMPKYNEYMKLTSMM